MAAPRHPPHPDAYAFKTTAPVAGPTSPGITQAGPMFSFMASQGPSQDAQQDVMDDMTLDPDPLLREQQNDAILDAYGNVIFQPDFFGSFAGAAAPNHGDALTSNPAPVSFFMPPPPPAEQLAPSRAEQKAALASVQTRGALRQYLANNGASEMLFKRFADILEINAQAMPANAVRATALALKQPTDEILAAAMEQWDDYIDFAPIYPPFAVNALANMHSTPVQHASASPFAVNALAVQHASATPEGTVRPGEYEYRHGSLDTAAERSRAPTLYGTVRPGAHEYRHSSLDDAAGERSRAPKTYGTLRMSEQPRGGPSSGRQGSAVPSGRLRSVAPTQVPARESSTVPHERERSAAPRERSAVPHERSAVPRERERSAAPRERSAASRAAAPSTTERELDTQLLALLEEPDEDDDASSDSTSVVSSSSIDIDTTVNRELPDVSWAIDEDALDADAFEASDSSESSTGSLGSVATDVITWGDITSRVLPEGHPDAGKTDCKEINISSKLHRLYEKRLTARAEERRKAEDRDISAAKKGDAQALQRIQGMRITAVNGVRLRREREQRLRDEEDAAQDAAAHVPARAEEDAAEDEEMPALTEEEDASDDEEDAADAATQRAPDGPDGDDGPDGADYDPPSESSDGESSDGPDRRPTKRARTDDGGDDAGSTADDDDADSDRGNGNGNGGGGGGDPDDDDDDGDDGNGGGGGGGDPDDDDDDGDDDEEPAGGGSDGDEDNSDEGPKRKKAYKRTAPTVTEDEARDIGRRAVEELFGPESDNALLERASAAPDGADGDDDGVTPAVRRLMGALNVPPMSIKNLTDKLPRALEGPHEGDAEFGTKDQCVDFLLRAVSSIMAHTSTTFKITLERLESTLFAGKDLKDVRNPNLFGLFERFLKNTHPECKERRAFDDLFGSHGSYPAREATALLSTFETAVPDEGARWRILLKHEIDWPMGNGGETVRSREKTFEESFSRIERLLRYLHVVHMFDGVVFLAGARYDVDRDAAAMIKVGMTSNSVGFIEEKLHMRVPEARHAFGVHVQNGDMNRHANDRARALQLPAVIEERDPGDTAADTLVPPRKRKKKQATVSFASTAGPSDSGVVPARRYDAGAMPPFQAIPKVPKPSPDYLIFPTWCPEEERWYFIKIMRRPDWPDPPELLDTFHDCDVNEDLPHAVTNFRAALDNNGGINLKPSTPTTMPWYEALCATHKSCKSALYIPHDGMLPTEMDRSFYSMALNLREHTVATLRHKPDQVAIVSRIVLTSEELATLPTSAAWQPQPKEILWITTAFPADYPNIPKGVVGTARCMFAQGQAGGIHPGWLLKMRPLRNESRNKRPKQEQEEDAMDQDEAADEEEQHAGKEDAPAKGKKKRKRVSKGKKTVESDAEEDAESTDEEAPKKKKSRPSKETSKTKAKAARATKSKTAPAKKTRATRTKAKSREELSNTDTESEPEPAPARKSKGKEKAKTRGSKNAVPESDEEVDELEEEDEDEEPAAAKVDKGQRVGESPAKATRSRTSSPAKPKGTGDAEKGGKGKAKADKEKADKGTPKPKDAATPKPNDSATPKADKKSKAKDKAEAAGASAPPKDAPPKDAPPKDAPPKDTATPKKAKAKDKAKDTAKDKAVPAGASAQPEDPRRKRENFKRLAAGRLQPSPDDYVPEGYNRDIVNADISMAQRISPASAVPAVHGRLCALVLKWEEFYLLPAPLAVYEKYWSKHGLPESARASSQFSST